MEPRKITPQEIEALVVRQQFHVFPGTTTTACLLELSNGFAVLGKSACVHADFFDIAIGQKVAREDAVRQIWQLEGYLMKERMHEYENLRKAGRTPNPSN